MANGKPQAARRAQVRRAAPRTRGRAVRRVREKPVLWATIWALLLVAIVGPLAVVVREQPEASLGERRADAVVARVDFTTIDREATREKRSRAAGTVPNVYSPNRELYDRLDDRLSKLAALVDRASFDELGGEAVSDFGLDAYGFAAMQKLFAEQGAQAWERLRRSYLREVFTHAVLSPERFAAERVDWNQIVLRHPDPGDGVAEELTRNEYVILNASDEQAIESELVQAAKDYPRPLKPAIVRLTLQAMEGPLYRFDPQRTEARREAAIEAVTPETRRVSAGEVLVEAGASLEQAELDLLEAERSAFVSTVSPWTLWLGRLGVVGMVALVSVLAWGYLLRFYRRVADNPMRGLAVTALLLLSAGIAVSVSRFSPELLYGAIAFAALLATMVLAIAYDPRFALAVGAVAGAVCLLVLGLGPAAGLTVLVGVAVAASQLEEVRTRSKLVMVGLYGGVAMGVAAVVTGLATQPIWLDGQLELADGRAFVLEQVLMNGGVAAIAGLFAGFVVQGILPAIEKLFGVTTAMTLKELNDASHPLLQRLAEEAPGTYQHSLRIADMAEAAAESIGADALACRVGAMYHDVGKMNKPAYFIENQGGGPNRHEKLSPAMSLLVIVGHVKDGVEMAREHNLPRVIRHFIESHHGTSLVQYFFHAAKKKTDAEGRPEPSEFEFRYPGPKPQTREAAIMLVCDGIESAARTLEEPTPVRLEQLVHQIANARLMDGQFDQCNLTLTELARIEAAITKTLCAVYHRRIKYPEQQQAPPGAGGQSPQTAEPPQAASA